MPFSRSLPSLRENRAVPSADMQTIETAPMTAAKRSEVLVTFDSEGAIFQNALGGYQIGADGTIHAVKMLFSRVNAADYDPAKPRILDGKGPLEGGETVSLGTLDAGESFGLFMLRDGWSLNPILKGDVGALQFRFVKAGTAATPAKVTDTAPPDLQVLKGGAWVTLKGDVYHTADNNAGDGNRNQLNDGGKQQAIGGRDAQGNDSIAFEDMRTGKPGSDRDFNDAVFDFRLEQRLADPLAPTLKDRIACIEENDAGPIKLGTLWSKDPDGGSVTFAESSADFEIRDGRELWYTGPALDYETLPADAKVASVRVTVTDDEGQTASRTFVIDVCDVDEPPPPPVTTPPEAPGLTVAGDGRIPEGTDYRTTGFLVGTLSSQDTDAVGTTAVTFAETSGDFEVRSSNELWYVGPALDFETGSALKVTVTATDNEGETADAELEIGIGDVEETTPPETPSLTVAGDGRIPEGTDYGTTGFLVGTLSSQDTDTVGTTAVTYAEGSGDFEIRNGNELWYTGPALDFETGSALKVTVTATDNEGETADAELEIGIGDLLEPHPGCQGLAPVGYTVKTGTDGDDTYTDGAATTPFFYVAGKGQDRIQGSDRPDIFQLDGAFDDVIDGQDDGSATTTAVAADIVCMNSSCDLRELSTTQLRNIEGFALYATATLTMSVGDIIEHFSSFDPPLASTPSVDTAFVFGGSGARIALDLDGVDDTVTLERDDLTITVNGNAMVFDLYYIDQRIGDASNIDDDARLCVVSTMTFDSVNDII